MQDGGRESCEAAPESWPIPTEPWAGNGPGPMGPMGAIGPGMGPGSRGAGMPSMSERFKRMQAMMSGERKGPLSFQREGAPVEFFAYGADLSSQNSFAPVLAAELRAGLLAGESVVSRGSSSDAEVPLEVAVRMEWFDQPGTSCAVVLVRQVGSSGPSQAGEFLLGGGLVGIVMLLVLVASVGPVVTRVRKLTRRVRDAAESHYSHGVPVEGGDELTELARAFNSAGVEVQEHVELLEQRERSLREFVEGTTHDVMLPLTVLQGHLVRLLQRASKEDQQVLGDALEEADYMASIVRNLGTAAKLEAGNMPLRTDPVDLVGICERVVSRHTPVAREKNVGLESVLPGEALLTVGDGTLFEQAVSNLVHNAVRYVDSGGHVVIVLSSSAGGFCLSVLDDGPGIPAQDMERLTERSWRADSARTRYPDGKGLGLAIAKEVATRHGMTLTLSSAPELGGLRVELKGTLVSPKSS